ncbi:MAG: PAS domain-containing sensor histidine kinase [Bacteroidetes bacterium]|nr:PAS domain-containing sensor histidine kinase [Bacteroidota bacterium]MBU1678530.1 PAS domain-containing sensor histidine kinase [Bacteroidota bacterium]MBU2508243.1 PAS domain-containing sensor histidine kinase [Bacteroidota bacterium]
MAPTEDFYNDINFELEKFKAVFTDSVDAITVTDGTTGNIIDANNSCKALLGYDPKELIGQHHSILLADSETSSPQMFGAIVSGRKIRTKNGNIIPMDITINTIDWDDSIVVITCYRDASERVKWENEIKLYAEQLNQLNKNKDKFFSIISHDLQNPITGLIGYAEILSQEFDTLEKDEIVEYSKSINNAAKDALELLENLMNWSRIQTGTIEFEPKPINVYAVVDSVSILFNAALKNKSISLSNFCNPEYSIEADEKMAASLFRNLISNAIKYSNEGSVVSISSQDTGENIFISITDQGIGISPEEQDNLFRIDVCKSTPGTNNEKGTGLGLVLCKEYVNMHNGEIQVTSKPGQGSEFSVILPKKYKS